jgi:glyoxylase-like metal-dependent hydrolase (beta-lactamase superfamily II)
MSVPRGISVLLSAAALMGACSTPPATTADLANYMLDAMGGRMALEAIEMITLEGEGTRTRLGQILETGGEDPVAILEGVTETIDLVNLRAALDNDIINGDFTQHRTEVLTTYNGQTVGWGSTLGRPNMATTPNGLFSWATYNSPEWLLRRNVITVALWAADSASDAEVAEEREFAGGISLYGTGRLAGEDIEFYFNTETGLLDGFVTLDTEAMLGDVDAEYILSDYRQVDGLMLPHSVTINKEGRLFASIDYTSIRINAPAVQEIFEVPEDIMDQAAEAIASDGSWSPITWNLVAPNVYHAVAFSHHSMVVEFSNFVAVVEGAYTEGQALTIARIIEEEIGKPIRYVVPTHPHYDHTGGIRGFASVGAAVMVAAGHEAELRGIVESPHTNPPDALAMRAAAGDDVGAVEVFEGITSISDGDQSLELYEVDVFSHVNPKVIAYVPSTGVVFQSDLGPTVPGDDADALYGLAREHGWNVNTVVGGHGGTNPFSEVVAAATTN